MLTQGVLGTWGSHRTPWHFLVFSPDRESAVRNAPALEPGPLARLCDLQLLSALPPQVSEWRDVRGGDFPSFVQAELARGEPVMKC